MKYLLLLLAFSILFESSITAQSSLNLDSILSIKHSTFHHKKGVRKLSIIKESVYDTNQVMVEQHRYNYMKVDTGYAPSVHYHFKYAPQTFRGSYYTEHLTHGSKPNKKYSKQLTEFKSYQHSRQNLWVKVYQKNSKKMLRKVEKTFDKNGYVLRTITTNYDTNPANVSTEKVQRNAAGNITFWESFDDDGDTQMQARSFEAKYKDDTLLVSSKGYLYHNWNEVKNVYDRKNVLKKNSLFVGTRGSNGKVKINDQTLLIYKDGKPYKSTEKKLKKTVKSIQYLYETTALTKKEIQKVSTPEKSYDEIKSYTYLDSAQQFLIAYSETHEGAPFVQQLMEYDTASGQIIKHTEIEVRKNGKDWKTEKQYNLAGNLISIRFYIANELTKEDLYEYQYQPPTPTETED